MAMQQEICPPITTQKSHSASSVAIITVTVVLKFVGSNQSIINQLVQLPGWFKSLMILSEGNNAGGSGTAYDNNLWLSLQPATGVMGAVPSQAYNAQGTEGWIPLRDTQGGGLTGFQGILGTIIKFNQPINQFYLSSSSPNTNTTVAITFGCFNRDNESEVFDEIVFRPANSGN